MTDEQIKHMTERFLNWKLPENFNPDCGISAKRPNYAPNVAWEPTGTNLFDYTQAQTMVRHMVAELPPTAMTREEFAARFRRWEHIKFEYGRWTATHENYDCSWEGEEDGWVANGWIAEGRTLEELADEIEVKEAEARLGLAERLQRHAFNLDAEPRTSTLVTDLRAAAIAIADTHAKRGDAQQAPFMSGGGADRQSPNPNPPTPRTD